MSRNLRLASGLRVAPRVAPIGARAVSTTPGEPAAAGPSTAASTSASPSPAANTGRTTHFGFQTVPEEQKESLGKLICTYRS